MLLELKSGHCLFQSTPSAWRVTSSKMKVGVLIDISIHTLRVEGDFFRNELRTVIKISIHTLRVEGDLDIDGSKLTLLISIHTLRVEGDSDHQVSP